MVAADIICSKIYEEYCCIEIGDMNRSTVIVGRCRLYSYVIMNITYYYYE